MPFWWLFVCGLNSTLIVEDTTVVSRSCHGDEYACFVYVFFVIITIPSVSMRHNDAQCRLSTGSLQLAWCRYCLMVNNFEKSPGNVKGAENKVKTSFRNCDYRSKWEFSACYCVVFYLICVLFELQDVTRVKWPTCPLSAWSWHRRCAGSKGLFQPDGVKVWGDQRTGY